MSRPIKKCVFPIAGTAQPDRRTMDVKARYSETRLIIDKTIIQFAVEEARAAGIEEFIFVTCKEKSGIEDQIIEFCNTHDNAVLIDAFEESDISPGEAIFVRQPKRLGIANAIQHARYVLNDEPFAIIIPNLLLMGEPADGLPEMVDAWSAQEAQGTPDLMIGTSPLDIEDHTINFGIVEEDGSVTRILEKPSPTATQARLAAFGRWIASPRFLEALDGIETRSSQFTDATNVLVENGTVRSCPLNGTPYDLRSDEGFVQATVEYALNKPEVSQIVTRTHNRFLDRSLRTLRSERLIRRYEDLNEMAILAQVLLQDFPDGQAALVSSFGAEAAVLLHMISRLDRHTPVLFIETEMLFQETLEYQASLSAHLELTDVRLIHPDPQQLAQQDPSSLLHKENPDACCHLRKTVPLENALKPFQAWITGRKRYQSSTRQMLPLFEEDAQGRIKVNPLVDWTADRLRDYMQRHDLPPHPLVAKGYPSIGCLPCTSKVNVGEDPRAGRWRDQEKVECGIHIVDGKIVRG